MNQHTPISTDPLLPRLTILLREKTITLGDLPSDMTPHERLMITATIARALGLHDLDAEIRSHQHDSTYLARP